MVPKQRKPIKRSLEDELLDEAIGGGMVPLGQPQPKANFLPEISPFKLEPLEPSYIKFSRGGKELEDYVPTGRENASSPGGQDEDAYRNYRRNLLGDLASAQEESSIAKAGMETAKAGMYKQSYERGENPELAGKMVGLGTFSRETGPNGEILGYYNAKTGQRRGAGFEGARSTPRTYEERLAGANRTITGNKLERLGELAKENEDHIGPYASKYINLQRSGLVPGMDPDPGIAEMYTLSEDLQNAQIYEKSGKQINEAEFKRLKKVMPSMDMSPAQFWAAYNNFKTELAARGISMQGASNTEVPNNPTSPKPGLKKTSRGTAYQILD